jgi:hypothetical protein
MLVWGFAIAGVLLALAGLGTVGHAWRRSK